MMEVAGSDATFEFEDAGHSRDARTLLEGYLIGELLAPEPPRPETAVSAQAQGVQLDGAGAGAVERDELYWRVAAGEGMDPAASLADVEAAAGRSGSMGDSHAGGGCLGAGAHAFSVLPSVVTWTLPVPSRLGVHEVRRKTTHYVHALENSCADTYQDTYRNTWKMISDKEDAYRADCTARPRTHTRTHSNANAHARAHTHTHRYTL